jgi:ribosomal-protein-alanine N-acetyltransferase
MSLDEGGQICLEVASTNGRAIRLYEKLGFKEDGMRKGYYDGKEDAVLMTYNIIEEN